MKRRQQRGFAMLAVMIVLALGGAAVVLSLDESVRAVRAHQRERAVVSAGGAVEHGLSVALSDIATRDVGELTDGTQSWELFDAPAPVGSRELVAPYRYPPTGPDQDRFRVRIGLARGQRTRAPPGEDVRRAYGQVVHVQLAVDADVVGIPGAERRIEVGVLLNHQRSHEH